MSTITGIFQGILNAFASILNVIIFFLPKSPFVILSEYTLQSDILKFLNYLLPIAEMAAITEAWLTAISIYYIYQAILKWVKLCG